jgi:hypothetical protein
VEFLAHLTTAPVVETPATDELVSTAMATTEA